jgi:uncharacterized RDD family membrane protein YckC
METGPENPADPGPQSPATSRYTGPVPPGGWQQPVPPAFAGGQLAGWGTRLGAYLLDILVLLIPLLALNGVLFGLVLELDDDVAVGALIAASFLSVLTFALAALLYAPLLMMREGERNGQTLGKQALSIRVVRDNGQPFDFASAALREVVLKALAVGIASAVVPILPWFLNYFWPLWDDENRALHDMAASTHVVRA